MQRSLELMLRISHQTDFDRISCSHSHPCQSISPRIISCKSEASDEPGADTALQQNPAIPLAAKCVPKPSWKTPGKSLINDCFD